MFNPKDSLFQIKFYRACPPFFLRFLKDVGRVTPSLLRKNFGKNPHLVFVMERGKKRDS